MELMKSLWTLLLLAAITVPAQDRALQPISVQRRLAFVVGNNAYPGDGLNETQFNAFARKAGSNDLHRKGRSCLVP